MANICLTIAMRNVLLKISMTLAASLVSSILHAAKYEVRSVTEKPELETRWQENARVLLYATVDGTEYLIAPAHPDWNQAYIEVEFEDEQFLGSNREIVYYARVIQEPSQAINANGFSCDFGENGQCIAVNLCGEEKGQDAGDCLGLVEERAWSSPIFVKVPKKPL